MLGKIHEKAYNRYGRGDTGPPQSILKIYRTCLLQYGKAFL